MSAVRSDVKEVLRFDGNVCGLGFGKRSESGDRNDPTNYMLLCPECARELGPLSRFTEDANRERHPRCPFCAIVMTIRGIDVLSIATEDSFRANRKARLEKERIERELAKL